MSERRTHHSTIIPGAVTVAVTSGKGGVGKTTTTVALAAALIERGHSVTVVDGDVHGPNVHLVSEVPDTTLGFDPAGLKIDLPKSPHGFGIVTPVSVTEAQPGKSMRMEDLISLARFADPVDVVIVDLPPGWTAGHEIVCKGLPELVVTVVAPSVPALSDHQVHAKAWTQEWARTVRGREDADRRRKIVLPAEPPIVAAETMARFLGVPDTGGEPVMVRRFDAVHADTMREKADPVVSIPAAATIADAAATPEVQKLTDMVTELLTPAED